MTLRTIGDLDRRVEELRSELPGCSLVAALLAIASLADRADAALPRTLVDAALLELTAAVIDGRGDPALLRPSPPVSRRCALLLQRYIEAGAEDDRAAALNKLFTLGAATPSEPKLSANDKGQPEILVPLVETLKEETLGWISPIHCRVEGKSARDRVHFANEMHQQDRAFAHAIEDALAAARHVAGELEPRFWAVSLPDKACSFEGASIGLGAALAALDALSAASNSKGSRLQGTIAATGRVDPKGKIWPVGPEGIAAKVEAAIYSRATHFLLSAEDLAVATEVLKGIDGRAIELVAARDLQEAWNDPRVSAPPPLWKRVGPPVWLALLAVAITATAATLVALSRASELASVRYVEPSLLIGVAADGQRECWDWSPPWPMGREADASTVGRRLLKLEDLDQDGNNDVAYLASRAHDEPLQSATLFLLDERGREQWRRNLGANLDGAASEMDLGPLAARWVHIVHSSSGEPWILAISTHHREYPAQLSLFNAKGELRGTYWHPGYFLDFQEVDLEDDGIPEILLAGRNHEFQSGALAVLRPDSLSGQPPSGQVFKNVGVGAHLAYVVLPPAGIKRDYSTAQAIEGYSSTGFVLEVIESDHGNQGVLRHHFDRSLRWLGCTHDWALELAVFPDLPAPARRDSTGAWIKRHVPPPRAFDGRDWIELKIGDRPPSFSSRASID